MSANSRKSSLNEDERIKALHRYGILDTPEEHEFDNITKLANLICNTPIALITMVDEDRLFLNPLGVLLQWKFHLIFPSVQSL